MRKILSLCLLGLSLSVFSQISVDTIYYDANGIGVDHPAFASYYRIALYASSAQKSNKYRDYAMDGKLISEGEFISIDNDVDSLSVFHGVCTSYMEWGNEVNKYNNGQLTSFSQYDNNHVERYAEQYSDNKIQMLAHNEQGQLIYDAEFNNELSNGKENFYENGRVIETITYENNIMVSQRTYDNISNSYITSYYENGIKISEQTDNGTYNYQSIGIIPDLTMSMCMQQRRIVCEDFHHVTGAKMSIYPMGSSSNEPLETYNCLSLNFHNNTKDTIRFGISDIIITYGNDSYIGTYNFHELMYEPLVGAIKQNIQKEKQQQMDDAKNQSTVVSETKGAVFTREHNNVVGDFFAYNGRTQYTTKTFDQGRYEELMQESNNKIDNLYRFWNEYLASIDFLRTSYCVVAPQSDCQKLLVAKANFKDYMIKHLPWEKKAYKNLSKNGIGWIYISFDIINLNTKKLMYHFERKIDPITDYPLVSKKYVQTVGHPGYYGESIPHTYTLSKEQIKKISTCHK